MRFSHKNKSIILKVLLYTSLLGIAIAIISTGFFSRPFFSNPDNDDYTLSRIELSEQENFITPVEELYVETALDNPSISFHSIDIDAILNSEGKYIDTEYTYLAYSFYIKNSNEKEITIDYYMMIRQVRDHMNEYVRVMLIEDDMNYTIYQNEDDSAEYDDDTINATFESENIIFRNKSCTLEPNQIKSFRVVIWLEEKDPDIILNQQYGDLEARLSFSIRHDYAVENSHHNLSANHETPMWIPIYRLYWVEFKIYYS
ncbi:hypothetical protein BK010_00595 [Tenericutes bacterium MO-XQ]|nr:hypothetical protein BK010_00595 [Tenericutes bacterium MO-XQ]